MLHTIRNAVQLISLGLVFLTLTSNSAKAWKHSEGEEDWGPTCFVGQRHSSGEITVLSSKSSFNPAMLVSLPKYPKNTKQIPVTFRWGNGTQFKTQANVDDYFGQVYIQLDRAYIDNLISRKSLDIIIQGNAPISVPLQGSSAAFKEFLRCTQASKSPPNSPPKTDQAVPDLVGEYVHSPVKNGWDTGSITNNGNQLRWTNKAGASWNLYLDPADRSTLTTRKDNPYYAKYPNARSYKLISKNGTVTGFVFANMTYARKSANKPAGDGPKTLPPGPRDTGQLGGMRLLPGYQHQPMQGYDSIVGRISKTGGLQISYEIGRVYAPNEVSTGGAFQDRPKLTPKDHIRWYHEQIVNGQPVHMAYRKDNILLVSYPRKGMNFSAKIANADEMAEMLLMVLTYPDGSTRQ